jgi:arginine-tRNA-protein transferase
VALTGRRAYLGSIAATGEEWGMNQSATRLPRFFFRTSPQACPYLRGRIERNVFTELSGPDADAIYSALVRNGFRRSHRIVYRPDCSMCQACTPVRVRAGQFEPTRSQARVWRRNRDLAASERPARATREQYRLFRSYVAGRHGDGEMAAMGLEDYCGMIDDTPVDTRLVEFRDTEGALRAACLVDHVEDGLSAVYSFFDVGAGSRSLGTYMVMWVIERARALHLPYAYLGYWIGESRKMAYKARFQPLEALGPDGWHVLDTARE